MTDVLTLGETMGAFRAAGPFRLGGTVELTIAGAARIAAATTGLILFEPGPRFTSAGKRAARSAAEAAEAIRPLLTHVDVLIASDDELPIAGDDNVPEVVVKHGAGDAFVAGCLSGLLDGLSPADRLQRGIAVAAFSVATPGDWQGLPTRTDLDLLDLQPGSTVR